MIEILRQPSQSTGVLLLFLAIAFIYVFLYLNDSRRFSYFFRSFYNKQYEVNYGRYSKLNHYFIVLLSVQSVVMAAFILSKYLEYCSKYANDEAVFWKALFLLTAYLLIKWLLVWAITFLFKRQKFFQEFSLLSAQYANLFFSPAIVAAIYMYLSGNMAFLQLSVLILIALLLLLFAKVKLLFQLKKGMALEMYYIILYLCTFELVPFLWLLIYVDC